MHMYRKCSSKQWFLHKLFSLVKRSETRLPSVSMSIYLGCRITIECKTRQDKEIQGINIFGKELKLSQFADDTTLLNSNCNLVNKAIAVLDNFGDISGLKLNPSKTEALWLGSWRHRHDKPFGFQWPDRKKNNSRAGLL